jgi:hypothetical protein
MLAVSLAGSFWSVRQLLRDPLLSPMVARSAEEIRAAADRALAVEATPDRLVDRLSHLLTATPRNWVAIDAVSGVADERGIALPPDLTAARESARAEDAGLLAAVGGCATCMVSAARCELSAQLLCQVPMVLTPIGDLYGIASEGVHYLAGQPVDELNLGLSAIGLGATALTLASGGSSLTLKIGASTARLAHRMGLLSPRLTRLAIDAIRDGIDWGGLWAVRSSDDLGRLLRPSVLAPVIEVARDTGRMDAALGPTATLYLLHSVDGAQDARHLADAAEALGPKTVGRLEVLGKSRFLRLTLRFSNFALGAVASLFGLILSAGMMLAHALHHAAFRHLRRAARRLK